MDVSANGMRDGAVPDAKAQRIMEVSRDSFLELGYAATSMDQVANLARVSKTTLYSRFPSKEDLFVATIANECEKRGLHFKPADFAGMSAQETLTLVARRTIDVLWSDHALRLHQSVLGERQRFPEVAHLFYQVGPKCTLQAVSDIFADLMQRGLIAEEDPHFLAHQFIGMIRGGDYCAIELGQIPIPDEEQRQQFCERAVRLFLKGAGA